MWHWSCPDQPTLVWQYDNEDEAMTELEAHIRAGCSFTEHILEGETFRNRRKE